jgi:hypothetical protein
MGYQRFMGRTSFECSFSGSFVVDYIRVYELGDYEGPTDIELKSKASPFQFYPNPASDQIFINWEESQIDSPVDISILNINGQIVKEYSDVSANSEMQMSDISKGIYFLAIRQGGINTYFKFVKN